MKKFLTMLLALFVCMTALPLQALAVSVPNYITDIGIAWATWSASDAKSYLTDNGYTVVNKDLNADAGGKYIYMGYKASSDYSRAITGIIFRVGKNPPNSLTYGGATFYLVGGSYEGNGTGDGAVDLNEGAGGDYIYTYITRDTNYGYPLMNLYTYSHTNIDPDETLAVNTSGSAQDLNSGAGGEYIYLSYDSFEDIQDGYVTATVYLRYRYLTAGGNSTTKDYQAIARHHADQISGVPTVPQQVNPDGYTLTFRGWRSDTNGFDPTTQNPYATYMDGTTISPPKLFWAVYSGDVTLTYNANGGSGAPGAQTKTVKARASTVSSPTVNGNGTFTLSSTIPTHSSRCKFLGWSTDKNATTAQYSAGQQVTFKSSTTLYAVWSDHTYSNNWSYDDNNHWHAASCGHALTKDVAQHSGGKATCMALAVCEDCGQAYGDYGDHAYGDLIPAQPEVHTPTELKAGVAAHYICGTCGKYFTEDKVETTLEALTGETPVHSYGGWINTDAEKHWKECSCGLKTGEGTHVCDNEQDTTCNTCGYERTIAHEHTFATTLSYDANNHWYAATCEHTGEVSGLEAHSGGSATCTALAVCEDCGQPYGKTSESSHTGNTNTDAWTECEDGVNHSLLCSVCGKAVKTEEHRGSFSAEGNVLTEKCGVCTVTLGTATITAAGGEYSGAPYPAEVTKTGTLADQTFAITYTRDGKETGDAPVSAGSYTASITMGGVTASVDFEIRRTDSSATAGLTGSKNEEGVYSESPTLTAPEGAKVSLSGSPDAGWSDELPLPTEDGTHTYTYYIKDENGQIAEKTVTVTVDTTPPKVADLAILTDPTTAEITAPATDAVSGVLDYTLTQNSGKGQLAIANYGDGSFTVTGMTPGETYDFTLSVRDRVGHITSVSFGVSAPLMPALPQTGDDSRMALWLMMLSVACASMIMLRRKVHN